jgi:hypothetical protein
MRAKVYKEEVSRDFSYHSGSSADYFCLIQNVRGPLPSHGKWFVPRNFVHLPNAVKLLLYNDFKCAIRRVLENYCKFMHLIQFLVSGLETTLYTSPTVK